MPSEEAPQPSAPGPLRVGPVLSLPPEKRGPVVSGLSRETCALFPSSRSPKWGGNVGDCGRHRSCSWSCSGFFIWQLLPPCLRRARPGGLQKGQLSGTLSSGSSLRFMVTGAAVVAVFDKFGICLSRRMELLRGAFLFPDRLLPQPWERFCF